jgi:hypothetical protein
MKSSGRRLGWEGRLAHLGCHVDILYGVRSHGSRSVAFSLAKVRRVISVNSLLKSSMASLSDLVISLRVDGL